LILERERVSTSRGRGRGRGIESSSRLLSTELRIEPDAGLDPRTLRL